MVRGAGRRLAERAVGSGSEFQSGRLACAIARATEWRSCVLATLSWRSLSASTLPAMSGPAELAEPASVLSTDVTVSLVEKKTQLSKADVLRLFGVIEGTGFNASGQMYRKSNPQPLDYGDVKAILEYFEGISGVRTERLVRNSPFVLGLPRSVLGTFDENKRYVEEMLELRDAELGKIISSNAYILTRHAGATARPCVEYLMGTLGLTKDEVRSIVLRFPRILLLSSAKMEDVRVVLREMVGVGEEFGRMMYKFPPLGGLSASKLKAARDWLVARGVKEKEQLRSVVTKFPQFLSHDLEAKMEPIVAFLRRDLGLPMDVVARALTTAPDLFGRSLETIKRNAEAVRALGLTDIDLTRYLSAFPGGLKIDVSKEPYKSKLVFLEGNLGQLPKMTLPVHPMYLTYGHGRIASRGLFLQEKGRSTNGVTAWLSASDDVFAEKFARSGLEEYAAFRRRLDAAG